jgi:hypothetical protein
MRLHIALNSILPAARLVVPACLLVPLGCAAECATQPRSANVLLQVHAQVPRLVTHSHEPLAWLAGGLLCHFDNDKVAVVVCCWSGTRPSKPNPRFKA